MSGTSYSATAKNLKSYASAFVTTANLKDPYIYDTTGKLSGIEINQSLYNSSQSLTGATQEFYLPLNYTRANTDIPDVTGFQIFVDYNDDAVNVQYFFDYYQPNAGWINLRSGKFTSEQPEISEVGEPSKNWYTIRFNPVSIDSDWLSYKFRLRVKSNAGFTKIYYQNPSPITNARVLDFDGINPIISSFNNKTVITTAGSTSATLNNVTGLLANTTYYISSSSTPITTLAISWTGSSATTANLSEITGLSTNTTYNISGAGIQSGTTFTIGSLLPDSPYTITLSKSTTASGTGVATIIQSTPILANKNITFTTGDTLLAGITLSSGSDVTSGNNVACVITPVDSSLAFRLLTLSADSGIDFLGNEYRSFVHKKYVDNVNQKDTSYWLSKPNPSKFAVENIYFDISKNNTPVSIDSVLLDPITPNVYFNVYYSNDAAPGYDDASWEKLLWTRVPKVFKATKKDVYAFPENISAKYIKLEFSHLQGKYYAPGAFQRPILYKKHPQWVFDYFIADYASQNNKTYDPFIQSQITIDYDILNLGFNYYKGDIVQTANGPIELTNITQNSDTLLNLLTNHSAGANLSSFDLTTLNQIKTAFSRFTVHPSTFSNNTTSVDTASTQTSASTISAGMINGKAAAVRNYPIENIQTAIADTSQVSTLNREGLIFEKQFPVMFFYVKCRHGYREAWARFEDDKAYFAGVKNVIFQRQNHAIENDEGIYAYGTGEFDLNVEYNDFVLEDNTWKSK